MKQIVSARSRKDPHHNEEYDNNRWPSFTHENKTAFFNSSGKPGLQAKLTVGQPNDSYEKEADSMANAVVHHSSKPVIRQKEISGIQRKSLATPLEAERLSTHDHRLEEDNLVQENPGNGTTVETEDEMVNMLVDEEEEEIINREENEEEDVLQAKGDRSGSTASAGVVKQLKKKTGKGRKLPESTKTEMESSFGMDFEDVNIHTDKDAMKMNRELRSQAFTHGKDIYFNSGKYNPKTTEGKHLLAHELTHVLQQNKLEKRRIQRQGSRNRDTFRQKVYVIRDQSLGFEGSVVVNDLREMKRQLMRTNNRNAWTLVLAIHGSEDRLAAQEPPNWQQNAIFYESEDINTLFNSDEAWVAWRNEFGPTSLSLVACQVSFRFENVLIRNLTKQESGRFQSAQGLGEGCKPLSRTASLDFHIESMSEYNRLNNDDRQRFFNQLRELNQSFGYYGAPPVPDDQILNYFFNETPSARWVIVEVGHERAGQLRRTGIPFWNRTRSPHGAEFRRLCNQGAVRLRDRNPSVPPIPD